MHTRPENPSLSTELFAEEPLEPSRGTLIDRFLVLEQLGAGGMGVVYAAHDPELDRKVALKLLLPRAGSAGYGDQARLMREAQALAKLAHPNVVAVHDVGTRGSRVWIAMEFVAGQTLTAWAKERPRRWTELIAVLADVARGMAAAHEAGLVHRDIKPDNVMIGQDGRVRVMDFGLAHGRATAATEPDLTSTLESGHLTAPLALRLTAQGAVQGTPAYMAPEQWLGHDEEPATDQFGWSVMAWELLYGERPFAGASNLAIATAVLAGKRRPPPHGRSVPSWLRRVLERGLATEPAKRWPCMAALLSALDRGRGRARLRTGAAALLGAAGLAACAAGYQRWDEATRVAACEGKGAEIEAAWNDEARQLLRAAFAATGASYAATSAEKVIPWLDRQAAAWRAARTEVCRNAEVDGSWNEELADRALWCLEDRRMVLESLVAEMSRESKAVVQRSVGAAANLNDTDDCLNERMLQAQPGPPKRRDAIREVRDMLSRSRALAQVGKYIDALALTTQARERATSMDEWPPLLASAWAVEGNLRKLAGEYEAAEAASSRAYFEAARIGAWDIAAKASIDLIHTVGYRRARHADGHMWARHAEVAVSHIADPLGLREAARLGNLAWVHYSAGEYAKAQELFARSMSLEAAALGEDHPKVAACLHDVAAVHFAVGAYEKAQSFYERAAAAQEEALGPDHPVLARTLANLAGVHMATGAYAVAQTLLERVLALQERLLGPDHVEVALTLSNLALVHVHTGARSAAKTSFRRTLAIYEKTLGPDHPDVGAALDNLASVHHILGEYENARTLYERALVIKERALGGDHVEVGTCLGNLANVHAATAEYVKARTFHARALRIKERALGADHPDLAIELNNLAEVDLAEERPRDALVLLERAVEIYSAHAGTQPGEPESRFNLARALVATHGDRERAIAEARTARDGLKAVGTTESPTLVEVEQWLTEYAQL